MLKLFYDLSWFYHGVYVVIICVWFKAIRVYVYMFTYILLSRLQCFAAPVNFTMFCFALCFWHFLIYPEVLFCVFVTPFDINFRILLQEGIDLSSNWEAEEILEHERTTWSHANASRKIPTLQSTNPSWLGAEPWSDAACARVSAGTLVSAPREWKIIVRWENPKGDRKISLAFSVLMVLVTAPNVSRGMCCIIFGRSWTVFLKWSVRLPLAFWAWRRSIAWNLMCFGDGMYCMLLEIFYWIGRSRAPRSRLGSRLDVQSSESLWLAGMRGFHHCLIDIHALRDVLW